jgi:Zn-dependent peptidase ImmA (M78 family)
VRLYRRAKSFQLNLEELYENEKPSKQSLLDLLALDEKTNLVSFAALLRRTLGKTIEEQSTWQSAETAIKQWRILLESKGIFVFKDAFENNEYSGFCLYDEKYPIIFINNSMPETRQVFTLFHELGHLFYRSGGIDFRSGEILKSLHGSLLDIEVSCNRFANIFLVPPDKFDSFAPDASESHLKKLADYFSVSREVILRNYLDRGFIDAHYYEQMAAKWAAQTEKKKEDSGGNYYYNQKTYLGENYIHLVYGKYYQNKITVDSLAEYLNVKPKHLPSFEHFVMEGGKAK